MDPGREAPAKRTTEHLVDLFFEGFSSSSCSSLSGWQLLHPTNDPPKLVLEELSTTLAPDTKIKQLIYWDEKSLNMVKGLAEACVHFADRREGLGICGWILVSLSFLFVLITFPISIWTCIKVVKEYERAVVFRLGRILSKKAKGPGLILILPCTDIFIKVDLRTVTCKIPPQEILTKDAVTTQVDGVVYYRIHSAVSAVANVTDVHSATFLLAQTTLRNVLGTKSLAQLLAGREEIAHNIQTILDSATDRWGIKVARVEIKDVRIPVAMQRAMAAEAEAAREARAKVVAAEGERNASKALKQASMVLTESPAGLQLRYLQTLTTLAAENNSTIVFPLPINMLEALGQKNRGG